MSVNTFMCLLKDRYRAKKREREKKKDLLFCLDGVGWSHIIAGDITALSRGQGASQPPVPLSAQMKR